MNRKQWTIPILLLLLLLPTMAAAVPRIAGDVIASGGGESTAPGIRLQDTLGQPFVGGEALVAPGLRLRDGFWTPSGESTPVFLVSFDGEPFPGGADLRWSCPDPDAAFRLAATFGDLGWELAWSSDGQGLFSARDESELLLDGGHCTYRLEGKLPGEEWQLLRVIDVEVPPLPLVTELKAPHPNPFNPTVTLPITMAQDGPVQVMLYDVQGRARAKVLEGTLDRGRHQITWSAVGGDGNELPSGVYFLHMQAAGYATTRKLVLLR